MLGRIYFTGDNGYQNVLVFAPMLSYLILNNDRKVTDWISTKISSENFKLFDAGLSRVNLKFKNSVLVQKGFS